MTVLDGVLLHCDYWHKCSFSMHRFFLPHLGRNPCRFCFIRWLQAIVRTCTPPLKRMKEKSGDRGRKAWGGRRLCWAILGPRCAMIRILGPFEAADFAI
eukprot:s4176_g4.t2